MPATQHRVTRGDDYRRIVRTGHRVGGAACITHAVFLSPESPARFGFIISKAVGNAVTRNLVRRRMKSVVQHHLHAGFTGMEVVFRARSSSATVTYTELEADMTRCLRRLQRKQRSEVIA